ncbi:MAG: adenosylmethionine decarboxylase [Patescibacteria group bacterium]
MAEDGEYQILGIYLAADLSGCENIPKTAATIKKHAIKAAKEAGATVKIASARSGDFQARPKKKRGRGLSYQFAPAAISVDIILAESHLTVHTWPELYFVAVDIFTCGATAKPKKALEYLIKIFKPKVVKKRTIQRKANIRFTNLSN